ncbi:MAG TPA: MBL fold metallo-hydrolase [Spirochaetales bacterium]|jgi:flavorubredoxin|nr:MBL fold metallo-hydrolase [Spirochaetales bacterium]
MKRLVKNNVSWVGKIDWELETFHGDDYSINNGSSQNAYLIQEEKTVLIDTVWKPYEREFRENLEREIDLEKIDFIVMNHGEVDHSGALPYLMEKIPNTPIYCTANAVKSLVGQYHHPEWNFKVVKTGDSVDIGNGKSLVFVDMRMLHWPDSMATYMTGDNILFSNDAFGQHLAVEELFNDKTDQCLLWEEALKYYANILAPFSPLVKRKIEEIVGMNLPIDIIAPSHGAIWRDNPLQIVEKYAKWADNYQEDQITIVYDTMWDGTKALAHSLANEIQKISPDTRVKIFNISQTDKNDIMTQVFVSKAIAVGSPTVGQSILSSVAGWLHFLFELKFKKKKAAVFGCYGWSGEGVEVLEELLIKSGFEVTGPKVKVNWNPKQENLQEMKGIAEALLQ